MRVSAVRGLAVLAAALGAFTAAAEPRERPDESAATLAGTAQAADLPRREPQLVLYFFDVHQQLDGQFDELAAETRAIFREMGVEVTWRPGGLGTIYGSGDAPEIPIIVLQTPPKGIANRASVLGLVPRTASGSKAVWIFVENLRRALAPSGLGLASEPPRGLGVAAGRVIAHEVVHALAPQLAHTREGLMRDSLSRAALTHSVRPTHATCVPAVQAALRIRPQGQPAVSTESALLLRPPLF